MVVEMRDQRMHLQGTELPREGDMLSRGDVLVSEKDYLIFEQRVMHLLEQLVAERLCHIHAGNLCAQRARQR